MLKVAGGFTLSNLLDKPWSQVSTLTLTPKKILATDDSSPPCYEQPVVVPLT